MRSSLLLRSQKSMNRASRTCVPADDMRKGRRLSARIAVTLTAVLLVCAGVELVQWRLRPLGEPALIEFPASPISQSEGEQLLTGYFQLITYIETLTKPM